MNTDVVIKVVDKSVSVSAPSGALRTREDIYSGANILGVKKDIVDEFLKTPQAGEGFTKFIIFKDGKSGPELHWIEIGTSDLSNVEVKSGLKVGDKVYVLPSKGLVERQERFRNRVKNSWG